MQLFFIVINILELFYKVRSMNVTVAAAQIIGLDSDLPGNLVRIKDAIEQASSLGAEIIVFPETILLGWVNPEAWNLSLPIPNNRTQYLGQLAKQYNVFLCVGLAELSQDGNNLYDTSVLIDNNGNVIGKHRKINILTWLMTPPYTPGNISDISVIETKFGKIGLLICADTFEQSILNTMKSFSPDLLLVPYGWADTVDKWPQHEYDLKNVVNNASEIVGCPVIGSDLIGQISHGPWFGQTYAGASVIADNKNNFVKVGKDRNVDIVIHTLQI
eukprot:188582_1